MIYFQETDLNFAEDIRAEVLDICRNRQEELIFRNLPWRRIFEDTPYDEVRSYIGVRKARMIEARRIAMAMKFGAKKQISFLQYDMSKQLTEALIDSCPSYFPRDELLPIVQISKDGCLLYPHKGHHRKASLFCLLEGGGETTKWWKETIPFDLVSEFRIPDINKCEEAASTIINKNVWLIFNHFEWHSVHSDKDDIGFRVNLGIDFKTWSADQIQEAIEQNV